ncbi:MAG: hypothetical protein NTY19_27440 [Planctomycetota bacterium]|nr:hypothetical protein [Planctomycetota bacterium]
MKSLAISSRQVTHWTVLVCSSWLAGCASLAGPGLGSLLIAEKPDQPQPQAQAAPASDGSVTMEIRPLGSRKPEMGQVSLQNTVFLQQALVGAGLVKRFRGMNIQVIRMAGDARQKMEAKYRHAEKRVDPAYDYALHPGDHLIITEENPSTVAEMMKSVTGPLGAATGVGGRKSSR